MRVVQTSLEGVVLLTSSKTLKPPWRVSTNVMLLLIAVIALIGIVVSGSGGTDVPTADDGPRLLVSTLVGSSQSDDIRFVERADNGDLLVVGYTQSGDFRALRSSKGGSFQTANDPFVMRISSNLTQVIWGTRISGSFYDVPMDMAVGPDGDVYVVGTTTSLDFAVSDAAGQSHHMGGVMDAFVVRIDGADGSIKYSTYLGGEDQDCGTGIAVDDQGRAIVVGSTRSSDFPRTPLLSYSDPVVGHVWTFVVRMTDRGRVDYASWLGAGEAPGLQKYVDNNIMTRVELDRAGCLVIAGSSHYTNLTTTKGSYQKEPSGGTDVFVCRLSSDAKQLLLATYVGGSSGDYLTDMTLDGSDDIVLTGWTSSTDFPLTYGAYRTDLETGADGFVTKLTADGRMLAWSTMLGRGEQFVVRSVDIGGDGRVYIAGADSVLRYGNMDYYYVPKFALMRFEPDGSNVSFNISFPHDWGTIAWDASIDDNGTMVVVGKTTSDIFPISPDTIKTSTSYQGDGFISVWTEDLTPPRANAGGDYHIDGAGSLKLNGTASYDDRRVSNWTWELRLNGHDLTLYGPEPWVTLERPGKYPVRLTVRDPGQNEDSDDAWILVRDIEPPVAKAGDDVTVIGSGTVWLDGSASTDDVGVVRYVWSFNYSGRPVLVENESMEYTFNLSGVHSIVLTVFDEGGNDDSDVVIVTVLDGRPPIAVAGGTLIIGQFTTLVLDGSASYDDVGVVRGMWTVIEDAAYRDLDGIVVTHRFVTAGTFQAVLQVWDARGNTDTDILTVIVNDRSPPRVDAGPDRTVRVREPLVFNASRTWDNTAISSWLWSLSYFGGEMILRGPGPHSLVFREPGVHFIKLEATDSQGNSASDYFRVRVVDSTPPEADAGRNLSVVAGEGVDLMAFGSTDDVGITEYTWYLGMGEDSLVLRGVHQDLVFDRPGVYYVLLVVRDGEGNTDSDWLQVTVSHPDDRAEEAHPFLALWILVGIVVATLTTAMLIVRSL